MKAPLGFSKRRGERGSGRSLKVQKFKGYVYENVTLSQDGKKLDVQIRPRKGASPTCSGCGRKGPVYDHLPKARRFEFAPLWQIAVFFVDVMRRVDCRHCKRIVVEQVPWSDGKHHTTLTYCWFLAEWGWRLSWAETAADFHTSWQTGNSALDARKIIGLDARTLRI